MIPKVFSGILKKTTTLASSSFSSLSSSSTSSVAAASALFDAASTLSPPPFARPQASGARLVAAIAERAAERTRASKADESLDKEASITTGRLMPALRSSSASDDALKSSAMSRSKVESVHVGAEALGRIERAMAGRGVSAGTRAGVRAVLAQKAAETAKASEAQSPLARLSSLKRTSEALGYKLPLTGKESSLLRAMEREQAALLKKGNSAMGAAGGGGGGFYRGKASSMRIPAPPLDLAASTLKPLSTDGKVLKRLLVQSDRRADLMQRAKTLLSVSMPSTLRPLH